MQKKKYKELRRNQEKQKERKKEGNTKEKR